MKERDLSFPSPIHLKGDITSGTEIGFTSALEEKALEGKKIITITVSSDGGEVRELLIMAQEMERIKKAYPQTKIRTIARGYANSAATILTSLGTKGERWAYEDTEFLLHEGSLGFPQEISMREAREDIYDARVLNRKLVKILSKVTGRTLKEIYDRERKDGKMSTQEALEFGLIDRIIEL